MQQVATFTLIAGLELQQVCDTWGRICYKLTRVKGIDFRRGDLGYSGCSLFMGGFSQNLIRRAQSDSGNCTQMLDNACVAALQSQLETLAMGYVATWTDNSPAPSNLTAGSLPRVCSDIRTDITNDNAVPDACAQFVGPKMTWYDGDGSNVTFSVLCKLSRCLLKFLCRTDSGNSYNWSKLHHGFNLLLQHVQFCSFILSAQL